MIKVRASGNFKNTERLFDRATKLDVISILNEYGRIGVEELSKATPYDTGNTAESWDYEIVVERNKKAIYWTNSNINKGVPIAIILQYGHGTNNGGYVQGVDYINPAMRPVFDAIADKAWREVTD